MAVSYEKVNLIIEARTDIVSIIKGGSTNGNRRLRD